MDGFVGEIRLMAISFVPQGWYPCDGTLRQIRVDPALYAIIGIKFGGDGQNTFGLPNLQARTAVGAGNNPTDNFDPLWGTSAGVNSVMVLSNNIPVHTHILAGATTPPANRSASAQANYLGQATYVPVTGPTEVANGYVAGTTQPSVALNPGSLSVYPGTGGPHENRQPYLAMRYFICAQGEFPMRN